MSILTRLTRFLQRRRDEKRQSAPVLSGPIYPPGGDNYCNEERNGHSCSRRPNHAGAHICLCYWRWPA